MKQLLHMLDIIQTFASTCMSIDVPVVTKNSPSSKPLKGLMSASICVRKFVSARSAPARNAPSYRRQ